MCSNLTLKPNQLEFTDEVPTFKAPDGRGYHVKRLVGNTARFYPNELEQLGMYSDTKNVVLIPDEGGGEPKIMPARLLHDMPEGWSGIKFTYQEERVDGIGFNGDIVLKLSRRTQTSKNYRINYVPTDSLLVYQGFDTHLKKSVNSQGKLDFFLVMHPQALAPDAF